ncbi:hypothetical protein JCM10207_006777 [Rhodosporidiobolus poonsookiae]
MVNSRAHALDASAAVAPEDDEPGHSGYSHSHSDPHFDASDPPALPTPELNPALLRQRLLNTLAPATQAHAAVSPREAALQSRSAPDLTREHGQGDAPSPAAFEPDTFKRTNTEISDYSTGGGRRRRENGPFAVLALDGEGPLGRGHVTPVATAGTGNGDDGAAPRPPLLSKALLQPKKPLGKNPSIRECLWAVLTYSWLNVLFVFVPVAWAMDFSHQSATIIFVFSFLAIVPCAAMLGFATEELALRVGDALGGLLNATFGNAVELIISILALIKGELDIVRSSMLGSILSNCLLVLGGCFFAGGIKYHEQGYSTRAAQLNINLLGIAVTAIVVPVAFHWFVASDSNQNLVLADDSILRLSRGIAFILLFVYGCYLAFQLWTHSYLYVPAPPRDPRAPTSTAALLMYDGPQPPTEGRVFRLPSWGTSTSSSSSTRSSLRTTRTRSRSVSSRPGDDLAAAEAGEMPPSPTAPVAFEASDAQAHVMAEANGLADLEKGLPMAVGSAAPGHPEIEHEVPKLSPWFALGLLVFTTVITGVTAEFLVSSIDGLTQTGNVSREFVALILLPVVGNAAEHVTAITVATKNKLDLSLAVAVGSSIQIALFVVPFLVILGWIIGQPLDLLFDPYETLLVFLCIVSVNWAISDNRSNWLEGMALMTTYVVMALVAWFYPGSSVNA